MGFVSNNATHARTRARAHMQTTILSLFSLFLASLSPPYLLHTLIHYALSSQKHVAAELNDVLINFFDAELVSSTGQSVLKKRYAL